MLHPLLSLIHAQRLINIYNIFRKKVYGVIAGRTPQISSFCRVCYWICTTHPVDADVLKTLCESGGRWRLTGRLNQCDVRRSQVPIICRAFNRFKPVVSFQVV